MEKVSIIVPIYNVDKYLNRCIDSVVNQTYNNLEIILVDDGSIDESPQICDSYQLIDKRIRVIHKENGGLSSARNAGLKIATGDYVYFVDGDDFIDKNLISTILPYFKFNNDICVFGYKKIDSKYNIIKKVIFPKMRVFIHNDKELLRFIIEYVLKSHHGWEAWNRIYKMDIIRRYDLYFFDNKKIFAEDLYFYICYLMHCKSIQIIDDCFYNYLLRENSIMSQNKEINKIKEFCCLSQKIFQHIKIMDGLSYIKDNYSLIHYRILKNEITRALRIGMNIKDIRKEIVSSNFCLEQYKVLLKSNEMKLFIKNNYNNEDINLIEYFLTGNYNLLRIKNKFLYLNIEENAKKTCKKLKNYLPYIRKKSRIYLIGYENFGNLGDHQIRISEIEFINKIYPNIPVITIPVSKYIECKNWLKKRIKKKDLIILTGGGNLGDFYPMVEYVRRDVILEWKSNKIVIFPQTMYFSNTENGIKEKEKTVDIYNSHKYLTLALREKISYSYAKKYFNCNLILCPDIVLSSRNNINPHAENKILLCLRNDVEQKLSVKDLILIKEIANKHYDNNVFYDDLEYFYHMTDDESIINLNNFFKNLSTYDIVITDRLHGMIFCAISGIKCIVLGNFNHKIKGVYQWINNLEYIEYIENINHLEEALIYMKSVKINKEMLDNLSFDSLKKSLM